MRIIRRHDARKQVGISRTTEFRLIRGDPTWPRIVEVTPQLTGYIEDELNAWIKARPRRASPELERFAEAQREWQPEQKRPRGGP